LFELMPVVADILVERHYFPFISKRISRRIAASLVAPYSKHI
jgi:hypothetical protein